VIQDSVLAPVAFKLDVEMPLNPLNLAMEKVAQIGTGVPGAKTPRELGYRMPAEWEPHSATWLAWPHNRRLAR